MTVADRNPRARAPRAAIVAAAIAFGCLAPSLAFAGDAPRADVLFKEGRALLDAKKFDEACPKLAESQKLEPGAGTLLALALCHEGQGKTATAHKELVEAASVGRSVGRNELADAADKRARAMEPLLSRLAIRMPEGSSGYDVRCDGEGVAPESRNTPIAVDPGDHKIDVSAKGKVARSYSVRVSGAGTLEILVDKLDDARAPAPVVVAPAKIAPAPAPEPADSGSSGSAQRTIGYLVGGLGVAGLGTGAYFGGRGLSQSAEAKRGCPTNASCPEGFVEDANERSKNSFKGAVVSVSIGTVLLATGAILVLTAPSKSASTAQPATPPKRTARIAPEAGPNQIGLGVVGTF